MSTYEDGTPMAGYEHMRADDAPSSAPAPRQEPSPAMLPLETAREYIERTKDVRRSGPPPGVRLIAPAMRHGESVVDYSDRTGHLPDPGHKSPEEIQRLAVIERAKEAADLEYFKTTGKLPEEAVEPSNTDPATGEQLAKRFAHAARKQSADSAEPTEADRPSFEAFKYQAGHKITIPASLEVDTRFEPEVIAAVARDSGIAARTAGLSSEMTQAVFNVVADGYTDPTAEAGFDFDRGLSEVRLALGERTNAMMESVQKFVATKPALAAYLDETSLGNHPKVLMALAAR